METKDQLNSKALQEEAKSIKFKKMGCNDAAKYHENQAIKLRNQAVNAPHYDGELLSRWIRLGY